LTLKIWTSGNAAIYGRWAFAITVLVLLATAAMAGAAGEFDPSFNGDGRVTTDFGGTDGAYSVVTDSHGRIVAAGLSATYGSNAFLKGVVARYLPDGRLDPTFAGDGRLNTGFRRGVVRAIVDAHDRVLVASAVSDPGHRDDFAVKRFLPDGTPDPTFSGDGLARIDVGGADQAETLAIDSHGRIVVGGWRGAYEFWLAIVRLNPNGTLDRSFSGDGKVVSDYIHASPFVPIAIDQRDRIVGAGEAWSGGKLGFGVARYNADGSFDQSFGKVVTHFGWSKATDVAVDSQGRVLAGGEGFASGAASRVFALARYRSDGSLDPSFGGDGKVTTDFGATNEGAEIGGIAIDSRGKILAAGHVDYETPAIARYNPNGSLDSAFGTNGRLKTYFGGGAEDVAVDSTDRILTAGAASKNFAVARLIGYP
jgi:uncharacterized delta-60 repeat protein